jgi:hypothetical protein
LECRCVPATITPTTFADGGLGSGSLRDAVLQFNADAGTDDDIIQLEAGTYSLTIRNAGNRHETAGLTGDLNLTQTSHRWIIQGAGTSTIIDASQLQDRVFEIVNPGTQVVFQDIVIQGGLAQDDGSDGAEAGSTDALGGGILNNGGDVTLDNVVIQNNVAQAGDAPTGNYNARGGGFYSTGGALTLAGAEIANNQAIGGRGTYRSDGGSANGGGLCMIGGTLDLSASSIASNQATGGRGGDGGTTSDRIFGGDALGGGLYVTGGSLSITASGIASNHAAGGAPGYRGYFGTGGGGGLYNGGALTVSDSTFSGNRATYNDGGIPSYGGGIGNGGTLTVSNSTLSGNAAAAGGGIGNGYAAGGDATVTVNDSTLSGNTGINGGGIFNGFDALGTVTVSNSTLSGNSAAYGGGISNFKRGTVTVSNSTLSRNSSGLYVYPGSPSVLHNTLIAGNFHGITRDDVFGRLDPGSDYNLIGDGTGMTGLQNGVNGNQVGSASAPIDPLLGPLDYYGGSTETMALLPGSPALNAGDPGQLGTADQRGVIRMGGVNIGAYQASASAFALTAPDSVQSGVPFDVSVTAVDPFGQVAVGYLGTITFSTSDRDPGVVLPADYSFQPSDAGQVTFPGGVTLITPGDQTLSVMDTADHTITGSALITVDGTAPGAGWHGREGQAQSSTLQGTAPPTTEPSHAEVVAGDLWFAALNERDLRFDLFPSIHDARAGGDWWALDPWWGGEPLVT